MVAYINYGDVWKMQFDIMYICQHAGKRARYYDKRGNAHSYIPFTLVRARKIFQLIKKYGDEGVILNTALYIKRDSQITGNKRILEQWEKA